MNYIIKEKQQCVDGGWVMTLPSRVSPTIALSASTQTRSRFRGTSHGAVRQVKSHQIRHSTERTVSMTPVAGGI